MRDANFKKKFRCRTCKSGFVTSRFPRRYQYLNGYGAIEILYYFESIFRASHAVSKIYVAAKTYPLKPMNLQYTVRKMVLWKNYDYSEVILYEIFCEGMFLIFHK